MTPLSTYPSRFYQRYINPTSHDQDERRREIVLNIVLVGLTVLSIAAVIIPVTYLFSDSNLHDIPSIVSASVSVMILLGLHIYSRRGHARAAAYVLVLLMVASVTELSIRWSFELPIAELLYVLTIVTAGVVLHTRAALIMTAIISLIVVGISALQCTDLLHERTDWANQPFQMGDAVTYLSIFCMIGLIAWLGNREIDRSFARARVSEKALALERDQLEIAVAERTRQLEAEQLRRMLELQRFAEFGRISAGLIHDLANPLTVVALNLGQLRDKSQAKLVRQAQYSLQYLERYLDAARKQLEAQAAITSFMVDDELRQVISILEHKARTAGVKLQLRARKGLLLYGDPVKFSQLAANLMGNAIDAYSSTTDSRASVSINASQKDSMTVLRVTDQGAGISPKDRTTIFDPFYTTKARSGRGIGIGLSIVKQYVEDDFGGRIEVDSSPAGTTFTVYLHNRPSS